MAINTSLCSSPNHSPNLPTLSLSTIPPSKFGLNLVSNEALVVAAAAEAVTLARAAAKAAREAVDEVGGGGGGDMVWSWRGDENESSNELVMWRKRNIRGKRLKFLDDVKEEKSVGNLKISTGFLSSREEADYCFILKEGAKLEVARQRLKNGKEHEPTSKELAKAMKMEMRSIDKVLCKERESQEKITRSYKRLVSSIASGYQDKGLTFQDLVQEGSIGLLRGAYKFDPHRGYKLSTYVYWWIRQAIIKAIEKKSRMVKLPGNKCAMIAKITEANNVLNRRLLRLPTYEEVAEELKENVSTVRLVSQRNRPPISLDCAVTDRGCMTLQEIIPGPDETMPEKMLKRELLKQEMEKLLRTVLSEREAHVVRLHFGLNGEYPKSFGEIGRVLKLSRERARQINGIAFTKLRKSSLVDNLRLYVNI
ncbi:RNA polymerase sigma factor sigD, chloroplastic [Humulus lupulus]|uniref:RNA polymerase sigma factor sigD, chloroplastic n=1 Tax=Humulus lupulus TaxID=3486 RepID=UPI002B400D8E|nr:RNA polymerase sigma factor sigD, chloroplastic [Humulus lupulus]